MFIQAHGAGLRCYTHTLAALLNARTQTGRVTDAHICAARTIVGAVAITTERRAL